MGETRVNLKHLLEDLRDAYPCSQEEAIITELIANALDSGASEIRLDIYGRTLTVMDNGKGMDQAEFEQYHDIAATTKARGKGIGFAGVGVKLTLLIAKEVITETRSESYYGASSWKLESSGKAPWNYIRPSGLLFPPTGTAVRIFFASGSSLLLNPPFVESVIRKNYSPILDQDFMERFLKRIYKRGILIYVNSRRVSLPKRKQSDKCKLFAVRIGKKGNQVGIGQIRKVEADLPEGERGIAISTYRKVIKRGWDWIGILPRNPMQVEGMVEIPELSEILTTNKADFLNDVRSLQKYYKFRRAIEAALEPILKELGELNTARERPDKDVRPIERELSKVLDNLLHDFPELSPLLRRERKDDVVSAIMADPGGCTKGNKVDGVGAVTGTAGGSGKGKGIEIAPGELPGERIEKNTDGAETGGEHEGRRKRTGLMIGFDDDPNRRELGWLSETTIWINKAHPAYEKVANTKAEDYHIVLTVAWVLSAYLQEGKSPTEFISTFMASWGSGL